MENSIEKQDNYINDDTSVVKNKLVNARKVSLINQQSNKSFAWLTDYSRDFLASGYLTPGVSAEERIKEIADRAEEILGINGYSEKFYNYMSQGFFSLASPVWSNFGKKRGLPISCFGSNISDDMGNILYTQSEAVSYTHLTLPTMS